MEIHDSILEMVMELGYDKDLISDLSQVDDEMYELLIHDENIRNLMERIRENDYYDKLVVESGVDYIVIMEKQYIEDRWVWAEMRFEEVDMGVNFIYSILSVPYVSESGVNLNVESKQIAEVLRREELVDLTG